MERGQKWLRPHRPSGSVSPRGPLAPGLGPQCAARPAAPGLTDAAVGACKARRTLAAEPVDAIDADAAVVAAGDRARVRGPGTRAPGQPAPAAATHQGGGLQSLVSALEVRDERSARPLPAGAPGPSAGAGYVGWADTALSTPAPHKHAGGPRRAGVAAGEGVPEGPVLGMPSVGAGGGHLAAGRAAGRSMGTRVHGEGMRLQSQGRGAEAAGLALGCDGAGRQAWEPPREEWPPQASPPLTAPPAPAPAPRRAHCACRCGPPSHRGTGRRRSPRCPRTCRRSRRGWAGSCCSGLRGAQRTTGPARRARGRRGAHAAPRLRRARGTGQQRGPHVRGSRPPRAAAAGPPHRCCRCCPSSRGGRHSGRYRRGRSRCRRCCRCRRRTGTRLRDTGGSAEACRGHGGARAGCGGRGGARWDAVDRVRRGGARRGAVGHGGARWAGRGGARRGAGGRPTWQGPAALTRVAGLALPAVITHAVEVVDQVVAAAAAVAGVREAVVGIWG